MNVHDADGLALLVIDLGRKTQIEPEDETEDRDAGQPGKDTGGQRQKLCRVGKKNQPVSGYCSNFSHDTSQNDEPLFGEHSQAVWNTKRYFRRWAAVPFSPRFLVVRGGVGCALRAGAIAPMQCCCRPSGSLGPL